MNKQIKRIIALIKRDAEYLGISPYEVGMIILVFGISFIISLNLIWVNYV